MLPKLLLVFLVFSYSLAENEEVTLQPGLADINLKDILEANETILQKIPQEDPLKLDKDILIDMKDDEDFEDEENELENKEINDRSLNHSSINVNRTTKIPVIKPARQIDSQPIQNYTSSKSVEAGFKKVDTINDTAIVLPREEIYPEDSEEIKFVENTTLIENEKEITDFFGKFESRLYDGFGKTSDKAVEIKEIIMEHPKCSAFAFGILAGILATVSLYFCCTLVLRKKRSIVQPRHFGVTDDLYETTVCSQRFVKNSAVMDRDEATMQLMSPGNSSMA